jgi:catechol 2,3-dioxygenase-like lactoylglutathione lyase family enzyme
MVSSIESVTVGVRDIAAAAAEYRDRLRCEVLGDAYASVGLLSAWKRPAHEGVRLIELGVPGSTSGHVRLAQFECEVEETSADSIFVGAHALSAPHAAITIVTDDPAGSRRFYVEGFGWRVIARLPQGLAAPFASGSLRWRGFAATDAKMIDVALAHAPQRTATRRKEPALPGRLGVNLCSCRCENLDELEQRLAAIGIAPVTRPIHVGLPGGRPGRVMLVRGPADELFELVEPET